MAGRVELLGIERSTNAEGETLVDLGVVCERKDAAVADLGLSHFISVYQYHSSCVNLPLRK